MKKVFFSQSLTSLAQSLGGVFQTPLKEGFSIQKQWIFIPSHSLKQFLLSEMVKKSPKRGLVGFHICTFEEYLRSKVLIPTPFELFYAITRAFDLGRFPELAPFFAKDPLNQKMLAKHSTSLFFLYAWNRFIPKEGWQAKLFEELKIGEWVSLAVEKIAEEKSPIHIFGFDTLSPLMQVCLESKEPRSLYLFSPSAMFWEDVHTAKEQSRLLSFWHKRQASPIELQKLEEYLTDAPSLLSNFGKVGRETLKQLNLDLWEIEQSYDEVPFDTALHALQHELLTFEKRVLSDDSIQVVQTGKTKYDEVLWLCQTLEEIFKKHSWKAADILVVAPDITPYIPWIELLFSKRQIPYRFSPIPIQKQSPFFQGFLSLLQMAKEGLHEQVVSKFFEKKVSWIPLIQEVFQAASLKQGIRGLLVRMLTLREGPKTDIPSLGSLEEIEEFISMLEALQADVTSLQDKSYSFAVWADLWKGLLQKFLVCNFSDEIDLMCQSFFENTWVELKQLEAKFPGEKVPFSTLEEIFSKGVTKAIHANHLHAVFFSSLDEGAIIPAKAVFVLGMDEESFPRKEQNSALNLLKKERYIPESFEKDRYLLLKILMNTEDLLYFSYSNESTEDGRKLNGSFVLEEFRGVLRKAPEQRIASLEKTLSFGQGDLPSSCQLEIAISDLLFFARHPWKYYLQEVLGISLPREEERSFMKERGSLLRSSVRYSIDQLVQQAPVWPGLLQEAFVFDVEMREKERRERLQTFPKGIGPLRFSNTGLPLVVQLEEGIEVRLVGEIPLALEEGALHVGDDQISSLLQVWPEILIVLQRLQKSNIYMLKTGKVKEVQNVDSALKDFLRYYLRCREFLSPLTSEWADALLRKTAPDFASEFRYEDATHRWVLHRLNMPDVEKLFEKWQWLKESFCELIRLYPSRERRERRKENNATV